MRYTELDESAVESPRNVETGVCAYGVWNVSDSV